MATILLRNLEKKDIPFFIKMYTTPDNMRFIPSKEKTVTENDIIEKFSLKENRKLFVIERISDNQILGEAGIFNYEEKLDEFELGYILDHSFWNSGYGTELCKTLIDYVFNVLSGGKVWCRMYKENIGSIKISEKNKMTLDREDILDNGRIRMTYFKERYTP